MLTKQIARHIPVFLIIALLVFVFLIDLWIFDLAWFNSAGLYIFFPWRMESNYSIFDIAILWGPYEGIPYQFYLVKRLFQSFSFPLWNPLTLAGVPFFASSHKQVLDPTNLLYFFVDLPQAINLQVTLGIFLLGIFGYLLAYRWTRDRVASLLTGVGYAFSSHVISKTFWAPNIGDFMWVPLGILVADKAAETAKTRYFVFFGAILSAIFLGGSDNYLPLLLIYLGTFLVFRTTTSVIKGSWTGNPSRAVFLTILPFALFVGFSAIRLLPYLENMALSDRTMVRAMTPWVLSGSSLVETIKIGIYSILNIFAPVKESIFFRTNVTNSFFLGATGALLLLPCIRTLAKGPTAFFFWAATLSIPIAALADPLILLVTQVPGLGKLPWLLQSVVSRVDRVATLYMAGTPILLAFAYKELKKDAESGGLLKWILWSGAAVLAIGLWLVTARTTLNSTLTRVDSYYLFTASFIALLLFTGCLLLHHRARISKNIFGGLIILLVFSELVLGTRVIFSPSPREEFYPEMPSLRFLKSQKGLFRVTQIFPNDENIYHYSPPLLGNLFMPFDIQSITGYQGILPRRHHLLFKAFANVPDAETKKHNIGFRNPSTEKSVFFYNFVELKAHSLQYPIMDLFNIRYVLLSVDDYSTKVPFDRYRLVYSNEVRIYENLNVMPRAYISHQARILDDEEDIVRQLIAKEFNPRRVVFLEENGEKLPEVNYPVRPYKSSALIKNYEAERVVIQAELKSPGYLVLTDSYHPGWQVKVNGEIQKIIRANLIFRAVYLESGQNEVEFIYFPRTFRTGLYVTLGTIGVALLLIFLPDPRQGYKK